MKTWRLARPDRSLDVKGPPAERAFDAEGNPTRAAEGFARSKGIDAAELKVEEIDGGEYVCRPRRRNGSAGLSGVE